MANEIELNDIEYRNYFIRPIEYPDGKTTITRFAVVNPDGTLSEYIGCRNVEAAKARIDAIYARSEALVAEAARKVSKPQIDAAAILNAADRFAANARKMGRHDNNPDDLI